MILSVVQAAFGLPTLTLYADFIRAKVFCRVEID